VRLWLCLCLGGCWFFGCGSVAEKKSMVVASGGGDLKSVSGVLSRSRSLARAMDRAMAYLRETKPSDVTGYGGVSGVIECPHSTGMVIIRDSGEWCGREADGVFVDEMHIVDGKPFFLPSGGSDG